LLFFTLSELFEEELLMRRKNLVVLRTLVAAAAIAGVGLPADTAQSADQPNDQQMKRLLESAAQATDRPDHDFAGNSIQHLLKQAKSLDLNQEQMDKIKDVNDRYVQTRTGRESAYKQAEMDALKVIHDKRSSLSAVETAVQKSDEAHTKLRMAGIVALREAADVLRPEQYSQWRQNHTSDQVAQSRRQGEQGENERIAPH